jgi:hypothetical protein
MARAKIRQNRRAIGGWFPPETYRRMRLLGAGHDLTIQQLLTEALDDLLHKYANAGKSPSTVNNELQADRDRLARECGALQFELKQRDQRIAELEAQLNRRLRRSR